MRFRFSKPALGRPSPALVISIIALIVAVGGGTFAIAASDNKKDKKIANGVVTGRAPGLAVASATNATTLGGNSAGAFEKASNILSAVVTYEGTTATVVRGTPGTTVTPNGAGDTIVTFPRDVSSCTWVATQGNPDNNVVSGIFATVRGNGPPNDVKVITWNTSGAQANANYHLLVVC